MVRLTIIDGGEIKDRGWKDPGAGSFPFSARKAVLRSPAGLVRIALFSLLRDKKAKKPTAFLLLARSSTSSSGLLVSHFVHCFYSLSPSPLPAPSPLEDSLASVGAIFVC